MSDALVATAAAVGAAAAKAAIDAMLTKKPEKKAAAFDGAAERLRFDATGQRKLDARRSTRGK